MLNSVLSSDLSDFFLLNVNLDLTLQLSQANIVPWVYSSEILEESLQFLWSRSR